VTEVDLLGIKITKHFSELDKNFIKIKEKIIAKINFWDRFKLSLAGRISIAKTFLVPVINYLGCIVNPSKKILTEIQNLIDAFVKKNLNISKERMHLPVALGGIGMFDLDLFLTTQRFSWLVRALNFPIDNWRYDLWQKSANNDLSLLRPCDIDCKLNPILHGFAESLREIVSLTSGKNFKKSVIFDNNCFKIPGSDENLTCVFFGRMFYEENKAALRRLTLEECMIDNRVKNINEFLNMGLNFNPAQWFSFRNAIGLWIRKYGNSPINSQDGDFTVKNFMRKNPKGSKKIRKTIESLKKRDFPLLTQLSYTTYGRLIDCTIPDPEIVAKWIGLWSSHFMPNELKTFLYNCRFNCLPLNNRLNAYLDNIDPRCTFCRIKDDRTTHRDNYRHCFFLCDTTRQILLDWLAMSGWALNIDDPGFEKIYWYGVTDRGFDDTVLTMFEAFRYSIFKCRLKKNIPNAKIIDYSVRLVLDKLMVASRKFKERVMANNDLAWFTRALG
jgi:hypothetical protein